MEILKWMFLISLFLLVYKYTFVIKKISKNNDFKFDTDYKPSKKFIKFWREGNNIITKVPCPHCGSEFIAEKNDFNIVRKNKSNDIGYITCPDCNNQVEISQYDYCYYKHHLDPIGYIVERNKAVYTTYCPICGISNSFQEKNILKDYKGKPYIICKVGNCNHIIHLKKSNTEINDYLSFK